jgi:hypothetical protein
MTYMELILYKVRFKADFIENRRYKECAIFLINDMDVRLA